MAYTFNIGHRLLARDATEDLPPRRTRFLFSPDATSSRLFLRRDVPLAGPAFGCGNVCPKLAQPGPSPVRRAFYDAAGHPLTANWQHTSTHAPHAARSSPANPFLESPADSDTRAPNLQRLSKPLTRVKL